MKCWLSIVKFVPDPGRGEFINIGAIAGSDDDSDWEVRGVSNWVRARHLDKRSMPAAAEFLADLQEQAEEDSFLPLTRERVLELSREMQNVVQITRPIPVVADSPRAAIDLAFSEIVLDPDARTYQFAKKGTAVKAVRQAYLGRGIPIYREARVVCGPYDTKFDFVVANGRALQMLRCWSFELPDQDELSEQVKAWAWVVRALRQKGADVLVEKDSKRLSVGRGVEVAAVFIPPRPGQRDTQAYDVALRAFSDSEVQVAPEPVARVDALAEQAARLLKEPHGIA